MKKGAKGYNAGAPFSFVQQRGIFCTKLHKRSVMVGLNQCISMVEGSV